MARRQVLTLEERWEYQRRAERERKKRWRKNNPDLARLAGHRQRLRAFGLTMSAYDDMLETQDWRCGICRENPSPHTLAVDHNHETGGTRGLLCISCNTKLGWYEKHKASVDKYLAAYSGQAGGGGHLVSRQETQQNGRDKAKKDTLSL